jgi:hypothetical protein
MAVKHGTRKRYGAGCRCDECKTAQRLYQRRYRERVVNGETRPAAPVAVVQSPDFVADLPQRGPVEQAVEAEVGALAQPRPTLVAVALAMARILDSSRVPTPKPPAAKVLVSVLDALHKGSTQGRRGSLAVVKSMTKKDGA